MNDMMNALQTYFRGVRSEWGKINWPERKQVITETFFVIVIVFVFTVSIYIMDIVFKSVLGLIK